MRKLHNVPGLGFLTSKQDISTVQVPLRETRRIQRENVHKALCLALRSVLLSERFAKHSGRLESSRVGGGGKEGSERLPEEVDTG